MGSIETGDISFIIGLIQVSITLVTIRLRKLVVFWLSANNLPCFPIDPSMLTTMGTTLTLVHDNSYSYFRQDA